MKADPHKLDRFALAQQRVFEDVLTELRNGRKQTHWMWFIFPQVEGLGFSSTSRYYAIRGIAEARQYLQHPLLGARLVQCAETLLVVEGKTALEIFGSPDDRKLQSSMTLFALVSQPGSVFSRVLDKYFNGKKDNKTIAILGMQGKTRP